MATDTTAAAAGSSTDQIVKEVTLDAPRSRVWNAITDYAQFSKWFGVALASPFARGAEVTGSFVNKKYEHVTFTFWVETIEPERVFSFRWHPYALDTSVDYSAEPTTLVSFTLEDAGGGTHLRIVESGFDAIPEHRRATAFAMNSRGWDAQAENIRKFVTA